VLATVTRFDYCQGRRVASEKPPDGPSSPTDRPGAS
jgi:hypothetical protein